MGPEGRPIEGQTPAVWPRGEAADCKSAHVGPNPITASIGTKTNRKSEMKALVQGEESPAPVASTKSATGAVLGSPILRSQGMVGEMSSRDLAWQSGEPGRPPLMAASSGKRSSLRDRRSLPSYISAKSISEAIVDLIVPNAAGRK